MTVVASLLVVCCLGMTYWLSIMASNRGKTYTIRLMTANESSKRFLILYYNPSTFISKNRSFENCPWNNCELTLDRLNANRSNAVIFDGIFMPKSLNFTRPFGQVWIFAAHESPLKYLVGDGWWYRNQNYLFNWTMTYNKDNTDIFLPYGEIRKYEQDIKRDFKSVAKNKNKTVLMVASHCNTQSRRQEYVKQLAKYIDIQVLGKCGNKWNCGSRLKHNDYCFQIINNYKFYLAFENALCHQYFTEKVFENYNYDAIMITRGGSRGEAKQLFPKGTYLATEDFSSIKDLGIYLKNLTITDYVQLLERKSQFYSTGYKPVYQRAFCDICKRMNFQDTYRQTVKNMEEWAFRLKPCLRSKEVNDIGRH